MLLRCKLHWFGELYSMFLYKKIYILRYKGDIGNRFLVVYMQECDKVQIMVRRRCFYAFQITIENINEMVAAVTLYEGDIDCRSRLVWGSVMV